MLSKLTYSLYLPFLVGALLCISNVSYATAVTNVITQHLSHQGIEHNEQDIPENRIDVVIVGEGFATTAEIAAFNDASLDIINRLTGIAPFSDYADTFTFHRIRVIPTQSTLGKLRALAEGETISPLGATIHCNNGARFCINTEDLYDTVELALNNQAERYEVIYTVVNEDNDFSNSDIKLQFLGAYASLYRDIHYIVAVNETANLAAVHEFGHAFARLRDTTGVGFGNCGNALLGRNLTESTDIANIPWAHWIEEGTPIPTPADWVINKREELRVQYEDEGNITLAQYETGLAKYSSQNFVGLFEAAGYCFNGLYRPTSTSIMEDGYDDELMEFGGKAPENFGPVNRELIVQSIAEHFNLLQNPSPSIDAPVALDLDDVNNTPTQFFSIELTPNLPASIQAFSSAGWKLDGTLVGFGLDYTLDISSLSQGTHTLKAYNLFNVPNGYVKDTTAIESAVAWELHVSNGSQSLSAPTNLTFDRCYVSWDPVPGATEYVVEYEYIPGYSSGIIGIYTTTSNTYTTCDEFMSTFETVSAVLVTAKNGQSESVAAKVDYVDYDNGRATPDSVYAMNVLGTSFVVKAEFNTQPTNHSVSIRDVTSNVYLTPVMKDVTTSDENGVETTYSVFDYFEQNSTYTASSNSADFTYSKTINAVGLEQNHEYEVAVDLGNDRLGKPNSTLLSVATPYCDAPILETTLTDGGTLDWNDFNYTLNHIRDGFMVERYSFTENQWMEPFKVEHYKKEKSVTDAGKNFYAVRLYSSCYDRPVVGLNAPTNTNASNLSADGFTLTWDEVSNADTYSIEFNTANAGGWTEIATTADTQYEFSALQQSVHNWADHAYFVRVIAKTGSGITSPAGSTLYIDLAPYNNTPDAPTGLALSNPGTNAFDATWNSVSGADTYIVQLFALNELVDFATTTATSYSLNNLVAGQHNYGNNYYFVQVVAVSASGQISDPSAIASIQLP